MLDTNIQLLQLINDNKEVSQRNLSKSMGVSLGKVNSIIKNYCSTGILSKELYNNKIIYKLTEEGMKLLEKNIFDVKTLRMQIHNDENCNVREAVILAAGKKNDFSIPVCLLKLGHTTIIERMIDILISNSINKIVIVTGFKSKAFEYLYKKYSDIEIVFVKNKDYLSTGTMRSLYECREEIDDDFILIESDLIFDSRAISAIVEDKNRDCVLISDISGSGDEAFVEIKDNYFFKMSKDIHQFNRIDGEMVGISKISYKCYELMLDEFNNNENPYINYEYTLLDVARNYNVAYIKIDDLVWGEIDSCYQLDQVKANILDKVLVTDKEYK